MRSYDRHAGVRAGTRPADGRFERLQRHRENIRRIARELNVDVSSGLVRSSRQGDDRTGSASVPPSAVQPKKTSLVEETSRPSTSKTNKLETSQPDLGEEIFDALQHYQPPKQTEETAVAPESSQGHSGQGAVSSSPAGAEGSPGPQTPSLPTATQTLTHTGSSVLEDAMAAGAAGTSAALAEAEIRPCRSCGHATPAGRFCQHCGQRLEANDPSSPAKEEGVASGPQDAEEPVNVDETFGSILSRWRQQFADFQRALGDAPSPEDVAPTSFPLDGDPEAFVQRIKKELGIDAGPLAIEPAPEARTPEVELLSSDVLRQIQAMSASFAEAEDFKHFEPEVSLHEAEALNEPLEPEQVEAADVVVAGSPPLLAEEVLLSRLSALEAEVLKLRGESAARPFPELSESPRREKTEATEVEAVEAQQAMSSLGMSLLSPSSLFASISDGQEASPEHRDEKESEVQAEPEKIAATPEEMPASASASSKVPNGPKADPEIKAELEEIEGILTQKSEAKFGEEEEKVEIEKTKTKESELNPRPITEPAKRADEAGAFFVPFTPLRPRKDTAVQVPEEAAAMQATQTVTLSTQELQEPKRKDDQKGSEDGSQLEQKAEQVETQMATMEEAEEEVPRRPATSPPQPAFVTKVSKPAVLPVLPPCGEAKPLPPEQGEAASFEKMHSEAGSGPLPSKTAGPPRPRSLPAPPKPSSPQRSGDVPWPKSPPGPYPPLHRQMFEGSPPMRWPELSRPAAFPPDSFLAPDGLGMPGMPPVWQGAGGWHARDKGEEDLMLHRAYEVYRQQQLDLLRQ